MRGSFQTNSTKLNSVSGLNFQEDLYKEKEDQGLVSTAKALIKVPLKK